MSSKQHEFCPPLISTVLQSAVRCSGFGQQLASCGGSSVVDAELWLVSTCRLQVLKPCTDDVEELVEKLRCVAFFFCALRVLTPRSDRSADIAPAGGEFIDLQACLCIIDALYGSAPCCRGWLVSGGRSLAVAIITAAATLTIPPEMRAAHAPALAWLAALSGERAEDVRDMTCSILRLLLSDN